MKKNGKLVISLDFELFWGVADIYDWDEWYPVFQKVHDVVPRLLELFERYQIHATWATVGALMADDWETFRDYLPKPISSQTEALLQHLEEQGVKDDNDRNDILFAPKLVRLLSASPNQEIGTHTFSHYYCDLDSSNRDEFRRELRSAKTIARENGYNISSMVLPRNQVSRWCLDAAREEGIRVYRGVEENWIETLRKVAPRISTLFWYLDNYVPLKRFNGYGVDEINSNGMANVRNCRFYKPYRAKYRLLEPLKVARYKGEIKKAAKKGKVYHMYWHPHNFAEDTEINFRQLEEILQCYSKMHQRYGMQSMTMGEIAGECD